MRIGVLENDIYWQNQILNLLMKYQFELNIDYDISIFNNELELCKDIANIDLLFIDIELNNENGISVAKKISNQKKDIIIVYLTSFAQFMADAFHLNVYKYILKSDLSSLKECVLFAYKHFQKTGLIVKSVDGQHFIKYQDIIYIESHYKKIFLYTCEEELLILVPSLKDFYNQLPSQFILINKQNIINFDKIILYNQNKILLEGEKDAFVVSRRKAKEVKDKYIIHMQRK